MEELLLAKADFLRSIFDAIPNMLLVVDDDVRILHLNAAATVNFSLDMNTIYKKRGGDVLHCIHSFDVPEGCGRGPVCKDCIVRNSVGHAMQGEKTFRQKTRMEVISNGEKKELHLYITASPFQFEDKTYVLLTLEDISELIQLRGLLPICLRCKKIKNSKGYWKDIAGYFSTHLDVEFSHGICEDCARILYPDYQPDAPSK